MNDAIPRVALFGGTFDPIHVGHLAAARAALGSGLIDEVRFVPAGAPPHKQGAHAKSEARWCMAVLATLDEPHWRVERWELDRPGKSFAIDTVREARQAIGPCELSWVIGTDAMAEIGTWHDVETLFTLTNFLVVARTGFDEAALRDRLAETVPWAPPEAVRFVSMPLVTISSTALRARLAAGDPALDALPAPVSAFIQRYGLYREAAAHPEAAR